VRAEREGRVAGTTRTPLVLTGAAQLRGQRVVVLTNPTGVTADLVSLVDQPTDLLTGTMAVREAIDEGSTPDDLVASWAEELARFQATAMPYRLSD